MQVNKILSNIDIISANEELMAADVEKISADSRRLEGIPLFFAYKGTGYDSHSLVAGLYEEGKIAGVVGEYEVEGVPSIIVEDGRKAFASACANYFGRSDRNLTMIGVTGTNGKTTTTWLLEKIFNHAGIKAVRIGTTGANVAGNFYELENTTPSPYDFHSFLAEGVQVGAEVAVVEVSSHAIDQGRLYGVQFDVAVFTNLSGDHLDYHKNMENYYEAKKLLFTPEYSRQTVINTDDQYGARLYEEIEGSKFSYGLAGADLSVTEFNTDLSGTSARINYKGNEYNIKSQLVGRFNLDNILAAVSACLALGMPIDTIANGVEALVNIPGRLEKQSSKGVTVLVDYAHTDDALKNVLTTLKDVSGGKLITVFGAGGDRDKTKRPRMGKIAQTYSDLVIVTSDNPRSEEPMDIINDILSGMDKNGVIIEPDRGKAIHEAINHAEEGDIVLIAGKGHEDYQIIGANRMLFSDVRVAGEALKLR